ncbi:MAG: hypothetical protein AAFX87_01445 [Bacteroidota bacterium]
MKKILTTTILSMTFVMTTQANNLQIDSVVYNRATNELSFEISWENAWRINAYRDGVWVFAKYKNANSTQWKPVRFSFSGSSSNPSEVGAFRLDDGAIIAALRFSDQQQNIPTTRITLTVDSNTVIDFLNPSFKVFGIEMVKTLNGEFYLGGLARLDDGTSTSFFQESASDDSPALVTRTRTSYTISLGGTSGGTFSASANYPNGFLPTLMMKYELTQSQFVDFLNCLTRQQQEGLFPDLDPSLAKQYIMTNSATPIDRNGITYDASQVQPGMPVTFGLDLNNNNIFNESDDGANLACNYLSVDLGLAYLDWAQLRPMTAMEYEKACRGFDFPILLEKSWGASTLTQAGGILNGGMATEQVDNTGAGLANIDTDLGPLRVGFAANANTNRLTSGGSFFGAMNLSDNVTEFFHLPLNASSSLSFSSKGDGVLSVDGLTDEADFMDEFAYIIRGGSYDTAPEISHVATIVGIPLLEGQTSTTFNSLGLRGCRGSLPAGY